MAYPNSYPLNTEVPVRNASDLAGPLDSSKIYVLDGNIDLGAGSINVPEGGLIFRGTDTDTAMLSSSSSIFTTEGAYSGRLKLMNLTLMSPAVFDIDGTGGPVVGSEVTCKGVNFLLCQTLGEIRGYRQGLWSDIGVIACDDGVTLSGTWSGGFASLTSITLDLGLANGTLFKAGNDLTMAGSFRSDMNAIGLSENDVFCDFSPANILADAGFSMEGVRTGPNCLNPFPNIPPSSVKASFKGVKGVGVSDTYVGGEFIVTGDGTTTITEADTLYQITATGTGQNLDWTQVSNTNAIEYLSSQSSSVSIDGSLSFSGGNNDQMALQVRQWDDSAGAYVNVGPEYTATLNGGLLGTRAENLAFKATATLNQGDRIEIWIKNKSDASDIATLAGGEFSVTER